MILFLYGKDTYRLQQKIKEVKARYQEKHGSSLNLEEINAQDQGFQELLDGVQQTSMFIQKKLFFVANAFQNQDFKQKLRKNIQKLAKTDDIIVLVEKDVPSKNDKLFQALKHKAQYQEFQPLKGDKLKEWARQRAQGNGAQVQDTALDLLLSYKGNDLWGLSNEIDKLSSFTKSIDSKAVRLLVQPKVEAGIFQTIDALAQKNKARALALLQHHLDKGDNPFYLLRMITFQFRNLLTAGLVRESGGGLQHLIQLKIAKPYPLRKAWQASFSFSLRQLKKAYSALLETDLAIKTGKIDAEEGIRMLVAEM